MNRKIYNRIFGDTVTIIEDGSETGGKYTLFEASIPAGSQGPPPHYHKQYVEQFTIIEGELYVLLGKKKIVLVPGNTATIPENTIHAFWTESNNARFTCKTLPAHDGQIEALKIAANLAEAGMLNSKGIPKNIWHMAVLFDLSNSSLPGFYSLIGKVLQLMAKSKRGQKVKQQLLAHYSSWSA